MRDLDGSNWNRSRDELIADEHLSDDRLIRMLDGELSKSDAIAAHAHVLSCPACKVRYSSFGQLSTDLELFVRDCPVVPSAAARQNLIRRLPGKETPEVEVQQRSAAVMKRFGWGMALAAALAFAILLIPREKQLIVSSPQEQTQPHVTTLEINGESFIPLPYSNPELPMNAPRIVEMQVPVSSLAAAGVTVEPSASSASRTDRTVLANVLLGIDGQPLGVHVLSTD